MLEILFRLRGLEVGRSEFEAYVYVAILGRRSSVASRSD